MITDIKINDTAVLLEWETNEKVAHDILASYQNCLYTNYGEKYFFEELKSDLFFSGLIGELSKASLMKIVAAPGASYYLLRCKEGKNAEKYQYFRNAILTELMREGKVLNCNDAMWTATGDVFFEGNKALYTAPGYWNGMFVDFNSPFATSIPLSSDETEGRDVKKFSSAEEAELVKLLNQAMTIIELSSNKCEKFVTGFTKSLVIRKRTLAKGNVLTRSPERFVGLKVFELEKITDFTLIDFIEGFVHESVHALLDIVEILSNHENVTRFSWIKRERLDGSQLIARSPWTGNPLPLPAYIHACFVWYSLVFFWSHLLANRPINDSYVIERFRVAMNGFLKKPLPEYLGESIDYVSGELVDTLLHMQERIKLSI